MTIIEHSAQEFTEAPDGAWGILWAHAPEREATGAYRTRIVAESRAMQTTFSSPGLRYTLVKRYRGPDAKGNGYRPLSPHVHRELYG